MLNNLQRLIRHKTQTNKTKCYIYIYIYFHHTTCESTCDTLSSSAANQGDNTVSVAQGGTATPGATKQILSPGRVFKRNIYLYIRQINKKQTLHWTFVHHFSAVCDLKTRLLSAVDVIATVSWFCVITREWWFHVHIIHVKILSISVIYSVCFPSVLSFFMRYCTKALETNVIYNSAERCYLLINGAHNMGGQ